jgi:hypothetical protein
MITKAKNPRWADKERTAITLDVQIKGSEEWMPFCARADDCEAHGVRLYYEARYEHKYGDIADSDEDRILRGDMDPPDGCAVIGGQIVNVAQKEREAEAELNRRLAALNTEQAKARAEIDEAYAAARKTKIAALLAVKTQEGWPLSVAWPE